MHKGQVMVGVLRLCTDVCTAVTATLPENGGPLGFLWRFQDVGFVNFIGDTLFKSCDDICWTFFAALDRQKKQ